MSAVHTPMPSDLLVHGWQDPGAVCGHADPEASPGAAPEVADIFRAYGDAYRATHRLSGQQLRVRSCGITRVAIATVPSVKPWPSSAGSTRVSLSWLLLPNPRQCKIGCS